MLIRFLAGTLGNVKRKHLLFTFPTLLTHLGQENTTVTRPEKGTEKPVLRDDGARRSRESGDKGEKGEKKDKVDKV